MFQSKRISARIVKGKLSQSEFNRQKGIIEGHLIPFFGSKQLASIRRKDVAEYIDMLTGAEGDGTIIKEVNVLKTIFNVGIEFEKVAANPAKRANLPKALDGRVGIYWRATWAACWMPARFTTAPAMKQKHAHGRGSRTCRSGIANSGFKTSRACRCLSALGAASYCSPDGTMLT